jgi:hypothetical protein
MSHRSHTQLRARLSIALTAGVAAIVLVGVLAASGTAQTTTPTLHLHAKEVMAVGFTFKGQPRQGDRFGFGDKLTGDDTGSDRGICTFIGRATALCTIQLQLSRGTITAQGLLPARSTHTPIAITGGTGSYNGARGTALLTDLPRNRADVTITLLP